MSCCADLGRGEHLDCEVWADKAVRLGECGFGMLMKLLGPTMVLLASCIICGVSYTGLVYILPWHTPYFSTLGLLYEAISAFIGFNIVFNYYFAICVSPGYVSDYDSMHHLDRTDNPNMKWCKKCNLPKPKRAHHCAICGKCTLKMDHHCPWVANCVGHFNYRYFLLFMLYLWFGTLWAGVMSFAPFMIFFGGASWAGVNVSEASFIYDVRSSVVFMFVICLSIFFAVSILGGWHVYLVLSGQTTIEFYGNKMKQMTARRRGEPWFNEFNLGMKKNFQQVFGEGKYWFSFVLPTFEPCAGDGLTYETRWDAFKDYDDQARNV